MIGHADLRLFYEAHEQTHQEAAASTAIAGEPVTCTKGCSACCYQHVVISSSEALNIATFVMEYPVLRENFRKYRVMLESHWSRPALVKRFKKKSPREKQRSEVHWSFQLPCPLLTDNDECVIYDVPGLRPLRCRTHQVSSPPENCAPLRKGGKGQRPVVIVQPGPTTQQDMQERMQRAGLGFRFRSIIDRYRQEGHGLLGSIVWHSIQALERRNVTKTEETEVEVIHEQKDIDDA
jgi:hypothetical protein